MEEKLQHIGEANRKLVREYFEIVATDDIDLWTKLLTEDCVFVVMPGGYTFRGFRQVAMFAKIASGTRTHDGGHAIKITNWFTDGENLCVEYTHGFTSLLGLPVKLKNAEGGSFCLVFHMRDGKFDSVHEYIDTGGMLKSILASFFLGILAWRTKRTQ